MPRIEQVQKKALEEFRERNRAAVKRKKQEVCRFQKNILVEWGRAITVSTRTSKHLLDNVLFDLSFILVAWIYIVIVSGSYIGI